MIRCLSHALSPSARRHPAGRSEHCLFGLPCCSSACRQRCRPSSAATASNKHVRHQHTGNKATAYLCAQPATMVFPTMFPSSHCTLWSTFSTQGEHGFNVQCWAVLTRNFAQYNGNEPFLSHGADRRFGGEEAAQQWAALEKRMAPLQQGAALFPAAALRNDAGESWPLPCQGYFRPVAGLKHPSYDEPPQGAEGWQNKAGTSGA